MCPGGAKSEPVKRGLRITHPPKSDFLSVLELNQILDLNFNASEFDFEPPRASKSLFFLKKLTFTIYFFFHTNSTVCNLWEVPGASKKRSEIATIFHDFLASILDRFWFILELQNHLKITKMTSRTSSSRALGQCWTPLGAQIRPRPHFSSFWTSK